GGLQTLNELAEAVAVDVVHVGEIEQNLLVAFVQKLLDQAGEQLVADADGEPPLKIDDDYITFFARLDVHPEIIYRDGSAAVPAGVIRQLVERDARRVRAGRPLSATRALFTRRDSCDARVALDHSGLAEEAA